LAFADRSKSINFSAQLCDSLNLWPGHGQKLRLARIKIFSRMKWIFVFVTFISIVICNSCGEASQKKAADSSLTATDTPKPVASAHTSMNSLDWAGVYRGKLPCADCEGVALELVLRNDLTFSSTSKYVGKAAPDLNEKGTFAWDSTGNKITLHPEQGSPVQYKVGENKVIQLDAAGNEFSGAVADKFVLLKSADAKAAALLHGNAELKETYWKLSELRGKPLPATKSYRREIHLILKDKDSLVTGFAGCNNLSGKYILNEGNRIRFSGVASTLMTCLNQSTEDEFKKVLREADNFSIKGDTLSLNKARMTPLARFTAVYLR